jgi:hypothetical protein
VADYRAERINKKPTFKIANLKGGYSARNSYVIGFDSESEQVDPEHKGQPFLYQFAHPDGRVDLIDVPYGTNNESLYPFLVYLHENCTRKDTHYTVVGFNLAYEYTQLFRDLPFELKIADKFQLGEDVDHPDHLPDGTPFVLSAMNNKRFSFTLMFGRGKRRIHVIDAMAFIPTSLDKASKMVGGERKKAKSFSFTRANRDVPEFVEYSKQDAVITQKLGEIIIGWHETYDVTPCISGPQFASKVYRHRFLPTQIELAHPMLEQAGLDSYHGGKNGFYLPKPAILKDVYHVDIRSAYPEAMSKIPAPETAVWSFATKYEHGVHALWHIRGNYLGCKYHPLYKTNGKRFNRGFVDAHVTGYELDALLEHGEIEVRFIEGWLMTGETGSGSLVNFVAEFYATKRNATSEAERTAAKVLLNSLYGKYFQKVALGDVGATDLITGKLIVTNPDGDYDYEAGGLYHPPIASLITGYVRGKIHNLEHTYRSVMTSTDGFFSLNAPDPELLGNELGQLSSEKGTLRIWRERLYIFEGDDGTEISALHGWRNGVTELRRVPMTAGSLFQYEGSQMVTLRYSARNGAGKLPPGAFIEKAFSLNLPGPAP